MIMIDDQSNQKPVLTKKQPGLVGQFIREKRERLNLSQKALGQRFQPSVTTQFISNVERGVTPLPPTHVSMLAQALQIKEDEIRNILEQEYAQKLSIKLGMESNGQAMALALVVENPKDHEKMKILYENLRKFDPVQREVLFSQLQSLVSQQNSRH